MHSLQFIPNQFQFISGGGDNSLRLWAVDEIDHSPRLFQSREGHILSSTKIKFYGYNSMIAREDSGDGMSMNILSAGLDRTFRKFHVIRENASCELSQSVFAKRAKTGHVIDSDKHLPVIVDFAYSEGRDRDWANVVTCHTNTVEA